MQASVDNNYLTSIEGDLSSLDDAVDVYFESLVITEEGDTSGVECWKDT